MREKITNSITYKYWISVIGKPAFRDAIPISKIQDRIMDIVLTVIVASLFVAAYGTVLDTSLQIGFNLTTIVLWFVTAFVLRFIVALIHIPAQIYSNHGGFLENPFDITPAKYPKVEGVNEVYV